MSGSRRSKCSGDDETRSTLSRTDSIPSSTSKRKSSKRSDPDRDGGFNPISTSFSSTSQSPYPGMAAPSVASSYATANTTNPTNLPFQPPDLIRNSSINDQRGVPTSDSGRDGRKKRDASDRRQDRSDSDDTKAGRKGKRSDRDDKRRSSKRDEKPRRTDSERALDNHKASMVENQFPGEFPSTFAEPYRPPGLAADYYGDQGESVAFQPGVRPVPPSIIIAADQAHLHEATTEAAPPPEPSSLGQLGAAASFYGGTSDFESDPPPKPSKNGKRPSPKPAQQSNGEGRSWSTRGPEGRPGPASYAAASVGPAAIAGAGIGAATGAGQAAEYFSAQFNPDLTEGGQTTAPSDYIAGQGMQKPTQGMQNPNQGMQTSAQGMQHPTPAAIGPPFAAQGQSSGSNVPMYGAAAAGLAAVGAASYYAGHHTTEEHHSMDDLAAVSHHNQNATQLPSMPQNYQSQQPMQQKRRRRGPFRKIVDFFQDPSAVAEYEAYTEAIGVCKYCFEPGSSPRDAPRKHHYNPRYSDGRYGSSSARVDKLNRYQSSEDEKRRRSSGKKWVATGLAGYGLAKMSEAAANRRNDVGDDYSVKSGRPEALSRVSFAADERVSESRRTKHSSVVDQTYSRQDSRRENETKIRKDRRTGELYEERSSRRRRDSSTSDKFSKGTAISAGVAAAGLAAAASRRKRSNSPRKRYYSKRVSPNHSYVDLSATKSGAVGFGSFFSSPSANQRKGKKSKGLGFFNFTNASSSSSDADLAFGAGSVRRKRDRNYDDKNGDGGNVNAEILGLAATGVALAAEGDRQERKGKRRADLMVVKESRNGRPARHDKKRLQSPPSGSDEGNDDWIDASDEDSSVESALAYGGRLSARPSRESLGSNDGTNKWAWRWNNGKRPRRKSSQDLSRFEPAPVGLVGAAIGAAATTSGRYGPAESTASLQSLQQLDPIPMSDPNAINVERQSSAISPMNQMPPPVLLANTNSAHLIHPQPFTPISQAIYSRQTSAPAPTYDPSGPPVFSQYPPQAPMTESPKQLPVGFDTQRPRGDEKRRRRRNSSPTPSRTRDDKFDDNSWRGTAARDSVKFDLTEEQTEKDRRAQARERRRSERKDRSDGRQADSPNIQQEVSLERERDEISSSRRSSTDARTAREIEIEKELEGLYEEDRRQREARKSKRSDTWPAVAAIGAGVAGVAAVAAAESSSVEKQSRPDVEESKSECGERRSRRKSALKQTSSSKMIDEDRSDSQQRRIARMAATRVKSTASPIHDDYASYFIPPELAEKVKEHNFAAEHRDDPTEETAQIVEVAPRTAQRKDTFDPFLYRPFGIEPEDDPRKLSWPVPLLDIIEPTPPVSVRGDMSPLPSKSPEPPEVSEEIPEKKQKRSSSVTWGEHRTHEYEVITPLEDHEEFVRTVTYESSQPAIDLAERTHSEVKPELSEPVTISVRTNGMAPSSTEKDVPGPIPSVDDPQPKANYGQDLEFAAVLAAATESAGFNPSIVVDDPTYHRRDSPPGSESTSFYRPSFADTLSDLGALHDYSVPTQRGFVEGGVPSSSADEDSERGPGAEHDKAPSTTAKDVQIDAEPRVPGGFNVPEYLDDSTAEATKAGWIVRPKDLMTANLDEGEEKSRTDKNTPLEVYLPAAESVKSEPIDWETPNKLRHSSTFDEAGFDTSLDRSRPSVSYASDPEVFDDRKKSKRKSSMNINRREEAVAIGAAAPTVPIIGELTDSAERRRKLERQDDDYYRNLPPISASEPGADALLDSKKSRRKSKRDSDMWDDTKTVASSPAELKDGRENGKKSKKKPKRDSAVFDDDTMSVSSLPADLNGDKSSSRKSKDKKSGGFFGLFSSSKSDTSTSQKRTSREADMDIRNGKSPKSDDLDEPKRDRQRKLTDTDPDDALQQDHSRSDTQPSIEDDISQQSPKEDFVSSEEATRDSGRTEDGMSFLGERPEMPTVLDGASGSGTEIQPEVPYSESARPSTMLPDPVSSEVRSRSVSPRTTPTTIHEPEATETKATSPSAQRDQFRQQHLAEIRTGDIFSSPLATSSPTAVPLHFRRLPVSPSYARSASVGSGSASAGSLVSPLVTSRSRQGRPTSTEFRNSKEFRPLYLVERHSSTKQLEPEIEETYPSLPSSRTSSAHPSIENLRGDDLGQSYAEGQVTLSQLRDRRHSFSYWRDERPISPDYLDSRTATPTATEFPNEVKREKPKYEFHSPSELLEDPSGNPAEFQEHQSPVLSPMVLPSVGSPESSLSKDESGIRSTRPLSPTRDQHSPDHSDAGPSVGLALAGGTAAALAASQVVDHKETGTLPSGLPMSMEQTQTLPNPSATPATQAREKSTLADMPISHEIEVSSGPPAGEAAFVLQPVSNKKSKKDRNKTGKTIDLANKSIEASSSSINAGEQADDIGPSDARSIGEQLPVSELDVRDMDSSLTASTVSFSTQPEQNASDPQAPARTRGAEIGNPDMLAGRYVEEQAPQEAGQETDGPLAVQEIKKIAVMDDEPSAAAAKEYQSASRTEKWKKIEEQQTSPKNSTITSQIPEIPGNEREGPAVQEKDVAFQLDSMDKSPFFADKDFTTSEVPSLSVEEVANQVLADEEAMIAVPARVVQSGHDRDRDLSVDSTIRAFDDTDRQNGLSEMASRNSYPFEESVEAPVVDSAALSQPSALEEAFVKAEAVRGTGPGVSEEEALQAFEPSGSMESLLGYGRLDTIVEVSREGSKIDLAQAKAAVGNAADYQVMPSGSEAKMDQKELKLARGVEGFDAEPEDAAQDDVRAPTPGMAEISEGAVCSDQTIETIPIFDPSINPFGDDYVLPREGSIDSKSIAAIRDPDKADASQLESAPVAAIPTGSPVYSSSAPKELDEPVEDTSWAPASKKDKKKGKKGRTSALISDASTPMTEMSSTESGDQSEARKLDLDSFTVSAKKGKKNKKKGQALEWTAEDETLTQEKVFEIPEQEAQKVAELEQDSTLQEETTDLSTPGGRKAKKNKKKSQALGWTDEPAIPLMEKNIDTSAESQREAPVPEAAMPEAEVEDQTWAKTKKSKKDKKKGKKSALSDETTAEISIAPNNEAVILPAAVEGRASALPREPNAPVPLVLDEVSLPLDDQALPQESSLPRDGVLLPEQQSSLPQQETSLSINGTSMPQSEVYQPQRHLQPSETTEARQSSAPEVHGPQGREPVSAKEVSGPHDAHELLERRESPWQATELVEPTAPASPSRDHVASMDPESSQASQEKHMADEDQKASAVRESRWASVFGELQQRNVLVPRAVPRQAPPVEESHDASTLPSLRWASIFDELKERKASGLARKDGQSVRLPNAMQEMQSRGPAREDPEKLSVSGLEQQQQTSVPAATEKETLVTRTETEPPVRSVPDPKRSQEQALEELPPSQVRSPVEHLLAHEQAHQAALEGSVARTISQSDLRAEGVQDQIHEDVHSQIHEQAHHRAQETAIKSLFPIEPEPQEAIVTGDREISDHRPESEILAVTQSETPFQAERPGGPETIGYSSSAPVEVAEEQAGEFSRAPSKKGKKDKKKSKSKQSALDELVEPSSESSRSGDIMPATIAAGSAVESETKASPIATLAAEPSTEADAFSGGPAMRIEDKKQQKSLASADETSTPTGDHANESQSSIPWPASLAHLANDPAEEKPISEKTQAAKGLGAEDEIQSQMEDMPSLPKQVRDSSPMPLMPEQPISEDLQVARDVSAESEIQSRMEDMSSLPRQEQDHALMSMAPEQQLPTIENDEAMEANLEQGTAQVVEERGFVAEPEMMPEEPEDYSWAALPKKKGKKDKKKHGTVPETSGSATPQTDDEPPLAENVVVPTSAESRKTEATNEAERASLSKKGKKDKKKRESNLQINEPTTPQTEDEPPMPSDTVIPAASPQSEVVPEGDWAPSAKKNKKDKKKTRTALSFLEDVAEPVFEEKSEARRGLSDAVNPEIKGDIVEPLEADLFAKAIAEEEAEVQTVEPLAHGLIDAEAVQSATEHKSVTAVTTSQALSDPVEGVRTGIECEMIDAVLERQPITDSVEANKSIVEDESILEHTPTVATEESSSWAPAPKRSKKDKKDKKKRKSTLVLDELPEDSSSPANPSDLDRPEVVPDDRADADSVLTSVPDRAAEVEAIVETTMSEPERNTDEGVSMEAETVEQRQQPRLPAVVELETAAEEDAQAFRTKKSKKEKKTKQESVIDPIDPIPESIGAAAAVAASEHAQRETDSVQADELALNETRETETVPNPFAETLGPSDSDRKEGPAAEPEEEPWGFLTKKSKKDKKKKRQSTVDEYSSAPRAPGTPFERTQEDKDMVAPSEGPASALLSEKNEVLAPEEPAIEAEATPIAQAMEEDFSASTKKKSKKDKKKKKNLLSWGEENDTSMDQPTETSTPASEPEPNSSAGRGLALDRPEETTTTSEIKSVDFGSSQMLESPAASLEASIPSMREHSNTIEDPVLDSTRFATRDLASRENTDPAEGDDGQRDFSTAKKSKKSKKAKKGVVESAFATARDQLQDFEHQEEGQKRSFSIPGAFEDESGPGSQSREVPEMEDIKEEQNVPVITEEPGPVIDVADTGDATEFITKPSRKGKNGKKGRQPSYLESDDTYPNEKFSERTVAEDDTSERGRPDVVGLGIATAAARAASSEAKVERNVPNDDTPLSQPEAQHDAQHFSVHEQAMRKHDAQHERDLSPANYSLGLPTGPSAPEARSLQSTWSFANLKQDATQEHANRDSGIQVSDSPLIQAGNLHPNARDSGYVPSPVAPASREVSAHEGHAYSTLARPPRPITPTSSSEDLRQKSHSQSMRPHRSETAGEVDHVALPTLERHGFYQDQSETLARHPTPVDSTTKDRSSALFNSSPSNRTDPHGSTPRLDTQHIQAPVTDLHRSPSVHGHRSREDLRPMTPSRSPTRHLRQTSDAPSAESMQEVPPQPHRSIFGPFPAPDEHDRGLSPPRTPLQTIHEHVPDTSPSNRRRRPLSDVGSPDRGHKSVQRSSAPALGELDDRLDTERAVDALHTQVPTGHGNEVESARGTERDAAGDHSRTLAEVGGLAGVAGPALIATEALRSTSREEISGRDPKSLGKSKSRSTSSKQLRRSQSSFENIASSSTHDPVREKGKGTARDMADIYVSTSRLSLVSQVYKHLFNPLLSVANELSRRRMVLGSPPVRQGLRLALRACEVAEVYNS